MRAGGGNICLQGLEAALWNSALIPSAAEDFLLKTSAALKKTVPRNTLRRRVSGEGPPQWQHPAWAWQEIQA